MSMISALAPSAVQSFVNGGTEALQTLLSSRVSQLFWEACLALSYLPIASSRAAPYFHKKTLQLHRNSKKD